MGSMLEPDSAPGNFTAIPTGEFSVQNRSNNPSLSHPQKIHVQRRPTPRPPSTSSNVISAHAVSGADQTTSHYALLHGTFDFKSHTPTLRSFSSNSSLDPAELLLPSCRCHSAARPPPHPPLPLHSAGNMVIHTPQRHLIETPSPVARCELSAVPCPGQMIKTNAGSSVVFSASMIHNPNGPRALEVL
jgi:hypothetical protein